MKITKQDLKNISLLSKIKIDDKTSSALIQDLESILTMVNKMEELETAEINPLTHPIESTQTLREDIEKKDIEREIADVFNYIVRLSDILDIDIEKVSHMKIDENEIKYPVDKFRGSSKKYNK